MMIFAKKKLFPWWRFYWCSLSAKVVFFFFHFSACLLISFFFFSLLYMCRSISVCLCFGHSFEWDKFWLDQLLVKASYWGKASTLLHRIWNSSYDIWLFVLFMYCSLHLLCQTNRHSTTAHRYFSLRRWVLWTSSRVNLKNENKEVPHLCYSGI